jgi:UDP-N-acetyl-D-mannosaminuronic acid transferase (WecB/TagA/CpsF family)
MGEYCSREPHPPEPHRVHTKYVIASEYDTAMKRIEKLEAALNWIAESADEQTYWVKKAREALKEGAE